MYRLLPESVVWLYANGRVAEAEQIIRNAAKLNNITMPDKILAHPETADAADGQKAEDDGKRGGGKRMEKLRNLKNSKKPKKTQDRDAKYTILDIFRNRHLTTNLLCMSFCW